MCTPLHEKLKTLDNDLSTTNGLEIATQASANRVTDFKASFRHKENNWIDQCHSYNDNEDS
jgi:hypothetical protein